MRLKYKTRKNNTGPYASVKFLCLDSEQWNALSDYLEIARDNSIWPKDVEKLRLTLKKQMKNQPWNFKNAYKKAIS